MIMRTIEVKLYEFDELSASAKRVVLDSYDVYTDYIYDEAHKTVNKFNEMFGTKEGSDSWLDIRTSHIDECILELSGFRLQKYIWNNFKSKLFKGKYFSLWSKTEKSYKHYKDGYPVLKSRYSKVFLDNCCVLTGVCYDHDVLEPIYSFLNARDFSNQPKSFGDLLDECMDSLRQSIEDEVDHKNSDESKIEEIKNDSLEYTEYGTTA